MLVNFALSLFKLFAYSRIIFRFFFQQKPSTLHWRTQISASVIAIFSHSIKQFQSIPLGKQPNTSALADNLN